MTEGSRRSDPRTLERRRAARRNLIIALIGFAIAAPALFLELSPAMEIRFRLAGVAFLATLFGSIGFTVLDAIGGLDPLPPVAVPIFAVGTWVVAWVALRWRVA